MRVYRWYAFYTAGGISCASGPHISESAAQDSVYKINDIDNEPVYKRYPTRQLAEAKRMRKYELSQESGSMGLALRPIRKSTVDKIDKECTKGVYD